MSVWITLTDNNGDVVERRAVEDATNLVDEVVDFIRHCAPEVGDTIAITEEATEKEVA